MPSLPLYNQDILHRYIPSIDAFILFYRFYDFPIITFWLNFIRLVRHHAGDALMPGLTARLLPAFLTQRRCAPLDFVTHTLFGRRHTAVAGVLWRLRVSYFDSFSRKSLFGSSRN